MIYLISEANETELPLAVAGSLNELSELTGFDPSSICRIIRKKRLTHLFGTKARIYKIMEDKA